MGYPYSHEKEVPILSKYFGDPEARTLKGWKARGGYEALKKALGLSPEDVVEIVKASGRFCCSLALSSAGFTGRLISGRSTWPFRLPKRQAWGPQGRF